MCLLRHLATGRYIYLNFFDELYAAYGNRFPVFPEPDSQAGLRESAQHLTFSLEITSYRHADCKAS